MQGSVKNVEKGYKLFVNENGWRRMAPFTAATEGDRAE
jgi:hypothetical protein